MMNSRKEIRRLSKDELPPGAQMLSREEALNMLWKRINNHPKRMEVWPFTYGLGLLSAASIVPGIIYTNKVRNTFKLRGFGTLITYGPCVVVPAMFVVLGQTIAVTNKLVLGEFTCTSCAQVRSAVTQLSVGWAWPGMLTPMLCFMVARKYNPTALPALKNFGDLGRFLWKIYRPSKGILGFSFVLQTLAAAFVIDQQLTANVKLNEEDRTLVKVR
ncbi:transmembrane protein 126-like [Tubulanus polymorphus]|uniref:transmembrane protein 126-like n=1 Tax=Tubulanus polymorphus TaxID=672921 RepID=UPI003DA29337